MYSVDCTKADHSLHQWSLLSSQRQWKFKFVYLDRLSSFHRLLWWNSSLSFSKQLLDKEGDVSASNWNVLYATANDIPFGLWKKAELTMTPKKIYFENKQARFDVDEPRWRPAFYLSMWKFRDFISRSLPISTWKFLKINQKHTEIYITKLILVSGLVQMKKCLWVVIKILCWQASRKFNVWHGSEFASPPCPQRGEHNMSSILSHDV